MADRELALKLRVVLSRACDAVSAKDRADVESRGVTAGEFSLMEVLYHKGPLLLGELQRKILVSSGGVTYLVDKLAGRGLVRREACPSDRRATYAALTEAGRAWMDVAFPEHAGKLEETMAGLDDAEKAKAIELLKKLGFHAERSSEAVGASRR